MRASAVAIARALGFLTLSLALGWVLALGVHAVTPSRIAVEAALAAAVLVVSWGATRLERRPFGSIGFDGRAPARTLGTGIGLGGAIVAGTAALLAVLGWYRATRSIGEPSLRWLVTAVVICALVALVEETLFRGYAFQTLAHRFGNGSAVLVTGLLFGALHLVNPSPGMSPALKLAGCACVAALGMLCALTRVVSAGLWLPIGLHFVWNLLQQYVFGFANSGVATTDGALLHATVTGPVILTGGAYGPDGGVVMTAIAGVSVGLLLWRYRRAEDA